MSIEGLQIGELKASVPIIQGGMGIGISLGGLAGAVAEEGGIGIISAAQIGFREPDFDVHPLEANLRAIAGEYRRARAISPDGIIGFNIMVAMQNYEAYVDAAIEAGADIIISGAGLPTELPRIAGDRKVKLAPIVGTCKSAGVILKYWDRKYHRIPDLLVVEGPLAGGHLGYTLEELQAYNPKSRDEEIRSILELVQEYEQHYGQKIPVALAGGIGSREEAAHAFALGADAIQVATRFVTTEECDADIRYKNAYIQAKKEDIVLVKSPVGMPGRAIRNTFIRKIMEGERVPPRCCHHCLSKCKPDEIPYCITDALIHAAKGEVDQALLFCGSHAYRASRIETVKEVIAQIMPDRV